MSRLSDFNELGLLFCIAPSPPLTVATDRDALIALYRDTDGDYWTYKDNWLSDAPSEYLVRCHHGRKRSVIHLGLSANNGLSGTIPSELGNACPLSKS